MRIRILVIFVTMVLGVASAQDAHFSQYYSATSYLSPSLAGSSGEPRLSLNYRNQWPGMGTVYETMLATYDMYFDSFNSGLGIMFLRDKAGSANLSQQNIVLQYSYRFRLNHKWQLIPGLQGSYGMTGLDFSKLQFGDAVYNGYQSNYSESLYNIYDSGSQNVSYFDFGSSLFLYSKDIWFGITADHINQPNQSFSGQEAKLPFKFVSFGGATVWRENPRRGKPEKTVVTSYRYQYQKKASQLDVGAYLYLPEFDFGIWYRGLPMFEKNSPSYINQDALVLILKYKYDGFKIGYSYDITISKLASHTFGSHEVSISYELSKLNIFKKLGKSPVACFEKGFDGRYDTHIDRRTKF